MDINNVPQDNSKTYGSVKKAIYAKDKDGKMKAVGSSGWEVEEIATTAALEDIQENINEAYALVASGKKSPLFFHMYNERMDLLILAQSTGFFQWTIKKDFIPENFKNIKEKRLLIYCDVLGKSINEIKTLPEIINE